MLRRLITFAVRFNLVIAATLALQGAYLDAVMGGAGSGPSTLAALALCVWFVYTLDRFVVHPEDQAGAGVDIHVARYIRRHQLLFAALLVAAVATQIALVVATPRLFWGLAWGDLLGATYILQFPYLPCRLKSVPYLKAVYVPAVAISTMLLLIGKQPTSLAQWVIVAGVFVVFVLNTTICDVKDIEADRSAGIRTIVNRFQLTRVLCTVQAIALAALTGVLVLAWHDPHSWAIALTLVGFAAVVSRLHVQPLPGVLFYFLVVDGMNGLPWLLERMAELGKIAY